MLQEERILRIGSLIAKYGRVSTERIARDLGVSRETVRRDILQIEALGQLRRVHGGVAATHPEPEEPVSVRARTNIKEKRAIARAALKLLQPGQTVFLDAGSTTTIMAEELASMSGLTLITNGLNVALKLAAANEPGGAPRNTTILLGGQLDASLHATYGEDTVNEIHRFRADLALLSPVGLSARQGATSFEHREAAVARAMAQQAQMLVILADHSKMGLSSRVSYAKAAAIKVIVTNARSRNLPAFDELARSVKRVLIG
jgi:DeoR/GlpR family transcriptional regulator of sugar metabolism